MARNGIYAGCLTGMALVASLFYPLYVVLPNSYMGERQTGSEDLGLLLLIASAVVLVLGGVLAGWWSGSVTRFHGAKLGALAGGIAGTMAFAALGAASAGTVGIGSSLQNVESNTVNAIIQTANHTYAALWGMLLGGVALGALGGWLAPLDRRGTKSQVGSTVRIAEVLSNRLLLVSLLILVVTVTTIPILLRTGNLSQQLGLIIIFNESVVSGFVVYLIVLLWILHLAQKKLTQEPSILRKRQVKGQFIFTSSLSLLALTVMFIALLFGNHSSRKFETQLILNPFFLSGELISIALISYMLKIALGLSKELISPGNAVQEDGAASKAEPRNFIKRENIFLVAWMGGVAFALPPLTLIPLVINLSYGVIPIATGGNAVDIVQDIFRSQALVAYGLFMIGAVSIVFSISIAVGLNRIRERTLS